MNTINIDLSKVTGSIKPVHSVNCAPYSLNYGSEQMLIDKYFKEANIPYCRLHDVSVIKQSVVDVSEVFPDFSADVNDPSSYDFCYSDEYISAIAKSGCEVYYRLGETIEWGSKKIHTIMPADFEKWARICEHIVMHYNEGWADGFHYDIKYWEIWNEPENPGNRLGPCMWSGSDKDFFELYKIASKHLKTKFPNIKIGGYGSCGFYPLTRENAPASHKGFITFFKDFLDMVRKENCPLDFFTWHIYTDNVKEMLTHAEYVRKTLDEYGFAETEAHLNEWNIATEGTGFAEKHTMEGASFNAAVFSALQKTDYVDVANYYVFSLSGRYNGLLNQNDLSIDAPWYPFVAFGKLYELEKAALVETDGDIYASAAADGNKSAILLSNYDSADEKVCLNIKNIGENKKFVLKVLNDNTGFKDVMSVGAENGISLEFELPTHTVMLIESMMGEEE